MRTTSSWLSVAPALAVTLTLAACKPPPPDRLIMVPSAPPGALSCPALQQRSESATVGSAGGVLRAGDHRLTVYQGALAEPVAFTLVEPAASYVLVHAGPDGQRFASPGAALTLGYARCTEPVPSPDRLAIYRWNPQVQQWDRLETRAGPGEREVTAQIQHLSQYAIGSN